MDVSVATAQSDDLSRRHTAFGLFWIASLIVFWRTIRALAVYLFYSLISQALTSF